MPWGGLALFHLEKNAKLITEVAMQSMKLIQGASLLEVMVALSVLSVGLLGMVGLQTATTKYRVNVEAYGVAAHLISNLTERIRVNPVAAGDGFNTQDASVKSLYVLRSNWSTQLKDNVIVEKNCEKSTCDFSQRAAFDMAVWREQVRASLPQGSAIVDGDRKSGIDITLMWMDKGMAVDSVDKDKGEINRILEKSPQCGTGVEHVAVYGCCPEIAAAPEGVRCLRLSFLP